MPNVPGVSGMPTTPVAAKRVATTMVQPPLSQVIELAPGEPEPALTAADYPHPSQEELAALSVATQNVAKRNTMTPSAEPAPTPAYKFTEEDRQQANKERWGNRYNWELAPMDDALSYLAELRAEVERGGLLLQKRVSELKIERVKCFGCDNVINLSEGRWATMRTRNNFETGIPESAYACSAACGLKLNREFSHPLRIPQPKEA
jgi:hypothetical protein